KPEDGGEAALFPEVPGTLPRAGPGRRGRTPVLGPANGGPRMTLPSLADSVEPSPQTVGSGPADPASRRRAGTDVWRTVLRNKKALVGAGLLLFFLVLTIFPGHIAPYSPTAEILARRLGPSSAHWFGTTASGQDVRSALIWSTRESVVIAFAVGGVATLIAVLVGVSAGYLGGTSDGILSLITDVVLVIPIFPLIIV